MNLFQERARAGLLLLLLALGLLFLAWLGRNATQPDWPRQWEKELTDATKKVEGPDWTPSAKEKRELRATARRLGPPPPPPED